MNGSEVSDAYWKDGKLDSIVTYCEKDVIATANIVLKLGGQSIIDYSK